jgi:hypothetical protein
VDALLAVTAADRGSTSFVYALLVALIGVIGVLGGALLTHYLNRKKTKAEIDNLIAETKKLRADTKLLEEGAQNVQTELRHIEHRIPAVVEQILYDSAARGQSIGYDFKGRGGQIWTKGPEARAIGPEGEGALRFEDGGVLNIERENKDGRYEVLLLRYWYVDSHHEVIPKKPASSGPRRLRVSCEAKVGTRPHSLHFVFRNEPAQRWLADSTITIRENRWEPVKLYFQVDPTVDCYLRIDDQDVFEAPSSIQIRKIIVAEEEN